MESLVREGHRREARDAGPDWLGELGKFIVVWGEAPACLDFAPADPPDKKKKDVGSPPIRRPPRRGGPPRGPAAILKNGS